MIHIFQRYSAPLTLAMAALLGGCVSQPKPLYHWSGYQEQVYEHFKKESGPEQQIAALEASLQEARARDETPAPGFHAHLGMLYAEIGKADQVRQQFETEKALFPESAPYMDFLIRNAEK
ncbi:DUF4810 domain-containing protein [Pseudomonas sp. UBA2684]|uniref:DUF4810 domain-containing protein n=1 Tax=Pseudomonas sp. UBA2684 TaxID=1947311 RepID=UPI000E8FAF83|nr:DUF4810 domain-containing protein [Pseudomonas sp. UBA2684]HBX57745.1 DUF4810 domain-containing protein [Pseudomonas sp.]|tara:strand:- start:30399 stop:30758 length:360 start_codon:yes stop_codon:yes gene_type:complete